MKHTLLLLAATLALLLATGAAPQEESVILEGMEDAYVVADVADPGDAQGLRDKNFGTLDFLKIWYVSKVQAQEQVYSIGLMKFDLSPLKGRDIRSAHLQLFALRADLAQPARLVDVSLAAEGGWNEREINFKAMPAVSANPIATTAIYGPGVWYSWDVSGAVAQKAKDGQVAFAMGLRTVEDKKEEQVVFASREVGRNAPRLVVTYAAPVSPFLPNVAALNSAIVVYAWQVVAVLVLALLFVAGGLVASGLAARRRSGAPQAKSLPTLPADAEEPTGSASFRRR